MARAGSRAEIANEDANTDFAGRRECRAVGLALRGGMVELLAVDAMTGKELGREYAFPLEGFDEQGLTKREDFARAAMNVAHKEFVEYRKTQDAEWRGDRSAWIAGCAVRLADALLDALAREST